MASFEIILLLLGCMLASSVFGQVLPRVSLPLAQIALGTVVGTLVTQDPTEVLGDPELFLVLFIAPLLFEESRHANKEALLRNWAPVASLAVGLVVVTTLVVGFTLHAAMPSIPLAAALALGAALGPTDAAAVAAMGADVTLTERQKSLLSGEAERALLKQIAQFCEEIKLAARDYDPSHINRYLQELAACFHRFYTACRIKGEESAVRDARLKLADDTRIVLRNGLKLIGVDAPEKM